MKKNIPVFEPVFGREEAKAVLSALKDKAISGLYGEYLEKFENEFSRYSGCKYGVATNSGTTALHVAIAALGIGPGDEVLVSTFTNMATCFAVIYQGAKVVPIDIDPDTWNINPELIERKINRKTKAVLIVHIFGHPCDMVPIMKIAKKHKLFVIEDCAEAHGATCNGKNVGSFGDMGCFSFYANKIITTGEGGMITTNNRRLYDLSKSLKSLAFGRKQRYMHKNIGFGYRMTNLQAAFGCAQLKKIDNFITLKRKIAKFYKNALYNVSGLQLPVEKDYARNVYWMYHILVHKAFGLSRNELMKKLAKYRIETRESFIPYNMQSIFIKKGWTKASECPVANYVGKTGLYLPTGTSLTQKNLHYIVKTIKEIQKGKNL